MCIRDSSLVLSRRGLSQGATLLEQFWQRLMPRADVESSPAARRLADDAKRVASRLPLSAVRSMGLTAAGGAERCRIEVDVQSLVAFVDPATGEPRILTGGGEIFDAVTGGATLVQIGGCDQLAIFTDAATGAPRVACASGWQGKVRIYDPVAGGEALVVLEVLSLIHI